MILLSDFTDSPVTINPNPIRKIDVLDWFACMHACLYTAGIGKEGRKEGNLWPSCQTSVFPCQDQSPFTGHLSDYQTSVFHLSESVTFPLTPVWLQIPFIRKTTRFIRTGTEERKGRKEVSDCTTRVSLQSYRMKLQIWEEANCQSRAKVKEEGGDHSSVEDPDPFWPPPSLYNVQGNDHSSIVDADPIRWPSSLLALS